jgi:predicted AlkP superfamily phosphohydrolase/phosphomutase
MASDARRKRACQRAAEPERPRDPAKRATLKKLAGLGLLAAVDITALASCGRRVVGPEARERKVIVLGLDGLDPDYIARLMGEGKLPNMSRLKSLGGFRALGSSVPPQSPVAWATFITGADPGVHGIYDFIQRDPETYLPYLSIARTEAPERTLSVGQWKLPLSQGKVELLRRGRAFWDILGEQGVPASVYRVPTNFPPNDTGAKQLAGLGAPDLRGTYGEFSYYTDAPPKGAEQITGGAVYPVTLSDGRARVRLIGPENTLREDGPDSAADLDIWVDRDHKLAKIAVQGHEVLLRQGEWSDWVAVRFEMLPHVKHVTGICRFYLKEAAPHLKLYVTPINVDPMDPALPIAAPAGFAPELASRFGRFYTQGFPQDVKALRQDILDDGEYLQQSGFAFGEARRMYESVLNEFRRGLLFYYFSITDRTQHMFWRTMDPRHPAHDARAAREYGSVIEDCYRTSDELVGQALEACDDETTLVVMSDHGFAPYYRSFNLNTWLAENGFLVGAGLRDPEASIFSNADWLDTAAYGIGFNSLYLNLQGREPYGRVGTGERETLARHLADELRRVRDPETGERVIENVYLAEEVYTRDTKGHPPDLVVGYARGYRCADESILGEVTDWLTQDNGDKWSGDHCIDRSLVPGMLLCNRPFEAEGPALPDVTAGVLAEFGLPTPDDMSGEPIW